MPSPFPGMDPYIETPELWPGFQQALACEIRASLNQSIRPRYYAGLIVRESYQYLEADGERLQVPLKMVHVYVHSVATRQLVTAIEILSLPTKRPDHPAFEGYERLRNEILISNAHLVEIDLVRGGERPPVGDRAPAASYTALVSRADVRPRAELWPISLRDPLPTVPIPLLDPDADAPLDLRAMVAIVYEHGAYEAQIDYRQPPPPPPLSPEESEWVEQLLRERRSQP